MNEFLFLALVIIYLVISYLPISGASKPTWQSHRNDHSSHGNAETDGTGPHNSPLDSWRKIFFAYPERYARALFDTRNYSLTVKVRSRSHPTRENMS
jgi:hypothetical protein